MDGCQLPTLAAAARLLELALVGLAGAPTRKLQVLREADADPLASLLALLALAAEGISCW